MDFDLPELNIDPTYHVWLWLAGGLFVGYILACVLYCACRESKDISQVQHVSEEEADLANKKPKKVQPSSDYFYTN